MTRCLAQVTPADQDPSILSVPLEFRAAQIVGETLRDVIQTSVASGQTESSTFDGPLILGGQVEGGEPRICLVYPESNFIEASHDTPYFQSVETKYGKLVLVRAYDLDMTSKEALKMQTIYFDATIRANLSVGLPLNIQTYEANSLRIVHERRVEGDYPYYLSFPTGRGDALRDTFQSLPDYISAFAGKNLVSFLN
mgnify:CR=1 FL=1